MLTAISMLIQVHVVFFFFFQQHLSSLGNQFSQNPSMWSHNGSKTLPIPFQTCRWAICTFLQHSVRSQSRNSSEPFSIMFSSGMLVVVGPCPFHSSSEGGRLGAFSPCHMGTISPKEERMQENYSVREFLALFPDLFIAFVGHYQVFL